MTYAPSLFSSLQLRTVTTRNRLWVSPMCQYSAEDGCMTDWHLIHLGHLALSGAGLLTIEATAVTPEGRISYGDVGLWSDETEAAMARVLEQGADLQTPPHAVISERHRQLLVKAHHEAKQARDLLSVNVEENAVLASDHLRAALDFLGQVTGRIYHDELLENIFSRFCIGK